MGLATVESLQDGAEKQAAIHRTAWDRPQRGSADFFIVGAYRVRRRTTMALFPSVKGAVGERPEASRSAPGALRKDDRTVMRFERCAIETRLRHFYKDAHRIRSSAPEVIVTVVMR